MKNLILAITLIVLLAAPVSGQIPRETPEYQTPVDRQESGECHRLMVENLYMATDPNDPLQEAYLLSAEAYRQLEEVNQSCL